MARILQPNSGTVAVNGRVAALLEIGSGFHPDLSGRENIYLNAAILGIPRAEIRRKFDEIVDFAGVERFIDQPVKTYSSGMYVRLAFAVAVNVNPEVLLVDEVMAVGDAEFHQRCAERFEQLCNEGRTVVIVSHATSVLRSLCDQAVWLKDGRVMDVGSADSVLASYHDSLHASPRVSPTGKLRWGSGEVLVDQVEVLRSDATPFRRPIRTGEGILVRIHYTATQDLTRPAFLALVEAKAGPRLWSGNSLDSDLDGSCRAGVGAVDLAIPVSPFGPGEFVISAGLVEYPGERVVDFVKNAATFTVGGSVRSETGLVSLKAGWSWRLVEGAAVR